MAKDIGVPISIQAKLPDHFLNNLSVDADDRNVIMNALVGAAKDIRLLSRRKMRSSKSGDYPARITGRMMRHVRVKKARPSRSTSLWARVQIDSFKDKHFWYPAPLFYGSKVRNIRAYQSPIIDAGNELEGESLKRVQDAIDKVVQGWFNS